MPRLTFSVCVVAEHYPEAPATHSPQLAWEFDGFGLYGHQDAGGPGTDCTVTCTEGEDCSDTCEGHFQCHCGKGSWTGMDFCRTSGDTGTCENRPVTDECNGHFVSLQHSKPSAHDLTQLPTRVPLGAFWC